MQILFLLQTCYVFISSCMISNLLLVSNIMIENPWFVYISGCNKYMCIVTYFQHSQAYKESCLMYNNVCQFSNIVVCCVLKADACACKYVHNKLNNLRFNCFFSLLHEWTKICFSELMFFLLVFDMKSVHFPRSCISVVKCHSFDDTVDHWDLKWCLVQSFNQG